jgi:hypothetical protein
MNIIIPPDLMHYLVLALPIVLPAFGSTVASLLQQEGFKPWLNSLIAYAALIIATLVSVYAAGLLSGDATGIVAALIGTATLLIHGALYKLKPYLAYLDALQSLSVVKPKPTSTSTRPITSNAYIPPEVRQQLGVPARASAVVPPTSAASVTQQHTLNTPATPIQVAASSFPVTGTATYNTSVQVPTGGNPAFPELHFGDSQVLPTVPPQ